MFYFRSAYITFTICIFFLSKLCGQRIAGELHNLSFYELKGPAKKMIIVSTYKGKLTQNKSDTVIYYFNKNGLVAGIHGKSDSIGFLYLDSNRYYEIDFENDTIIRFFYTVKNSESKKIIEYIIWNLRSIDSADSYILLPNSEYNILTTVKNQNGLIIRTSFASVVNNQNKYYNFDTFYYLKNLKLPYRSETWVQGMAYLYDTYFNYDSSGNLLKFLRYTYQDSILKTGYKDNPYMRITEYRGNLEVKGSVLNGDFKSLWKIKYSDFDSSGNYTKKITKNYYFGTQRKLFGRYSITKEIRILEYY